MDGIIRAWGKILTGVRPALSVEITQECPLRCSGCYAYLDDHLGDSVGLRQLGDYQGQALVDRFFQLIDEHDPLHVSIVGGEPLVRYRELNQILPRLSERGVHTQVVTSAVRPIPQEWKGLRNLEISVSIDGLQPEHDVRRTPATYDRILRYVVGHQISVHCTVTRQQVRRAGYLEEFVRLWSENDAVRKILVSLYTPQVGEVSDERLTPADRSAVVADLLHLREQFPKLRMPRAMIEVYATPPPSPEECVFSQMTSCISADFRTRISPCQFGGSPIAPTADARPRPGSARSAGTGCLCASGSAPSSRRHSVWALRSTGCGQVRRPELLRPGCILEVSDMP